MLCHTSVLASGITAEMNSILSANKLELKIKIAGIPAMQVASMGAVPLASCWQLPMVWVCQGWLVPAVWPEGFVIFSLCLNVCKPNQIQEVPAVPCSWFLLWYNWGQVVVWEMGTAVMLSIAQSPMGGVHGSAGCSSGPGYGLTASSRKQWRWDQGAASLSSYSVLLVLGQWMKGP